MEYVIRDSLFLQFLNQTTIFIITQYFFQLKVLNFEIRLVYLKLGQVHIKKRKIEYLLNADFIASKNDDNKWLLKIKTHLCSREFDEEENSLNYTKSYFTIKLTITDFVFGVPLIYILFVYMYTLSEIQQKLLKQRRR